jgi:hypothetical protein
MIPGRRDAQIYQSSRENSFSVRPAFLLSLNQKIFRQEGEESSGSCRQLLVVHELATVQAAGYPRLSSLS